MYNEHLSNESKFCVELYKNDLNYLNMLCRGVKLDHYLFNVIIKPSSPLDWTIFR